MDTILTFWDRNRDYGLGLTAGLSAEQFVEQPGGAANHPAWVLSHLCAYHAVLLPLLHGEAFDDPADAAFGMRSKPEPDTDCYAPPEQLRETFRRGHDEIAQALRQQGDAVFARPVPLERWRKSLPTMDAVLMNLLVWHETVHLGQLSAWRRVLGHPPVSFMPLPT